MLSNVENRTACEANWGSFPNSSAIRAVLTAVGMLVDMSNVFAMIPLKLNNLSSNNATRGATNKRNTADIITSKIL